MNIRVLMFEKFYVCQPTKPSFTMLEASYEKHRPNWFKGLNSCRKWRLCGWSVDTVFGYCLPLVWSDKVWEVIWFLLFALVMPISCMPRSRCAYVYFTQDVLMYILQWLMLSSAFVKTNKWKSITYVLWIHGMKFCHHTKNEFFHHPRFPKYKYS